MPKPEYGGSYERTMISDELGHTNRFNISWDTAHRAISGHGSAILSKLGLPSDRNPRMLTMAEYNLLANRDGLSVTADTLEWIGDEYYKPGYPSARLIAGNFDYGGAASVGWARPDRPESHIGFRVAVPLR